MNKASIGLCIVGCGGYARMVLDDIYDMKDFVDLYFASRDLDKARQYCEDYDGVDYFDSYEQAASDSRVQALYIFTPHDLHLESVQLAAHYRKHILLEKPIARTISEATEITQIAEASDVNFMIAENFRFLPMIDKCKELIESGVIGSLKVVNAQHQGFDKAIEWRTEAARNGGGRLIDGGIHFVDVLLNIGGIPEKLYAVEEKHKIIPNHEGEEGVSLTAHLPNKVVGMMRYAGGSPIIEHRNLVQVTGTKGMLTFDPMGSEMELDAPSGKEIIFTDSPSRGVRQMVAEFCNSINEGREPIMSGQEAINDLAVVLAAYQSISHGEVVGLNP